MCNIYIYIGGVGSKSASVSDASVSDPPLPTQLPEQPPRARGAGENVLENALENALAGMARPSSSTRASTGEATTTTAEATTSNAEAHSPGIPEAEAVAPERPITMIHQEAMAPERPITIPRVMLASMPSMPMTMARVILPSDLNKVPFLSVSISLYKGARGDSG